MLRKSFCIFGYLRCGSGLLGSQDLLDLGKIFEVGGMLIVLIFWGLHARESHVSRECIIGGSIVPGVAMLLLLFVVSIGRIFWYPALLSA